MRFIANGLNNKYLMNILPQAESDVESVSQVFAAIAYGQNNNEKFVENCIKNGFRLDIWMRYDHTVPVDPELLKKLNRPGRNIFCKLVRDYLHSKVMWWKGYGAYIGSANLTDAAWNRNIEAGVFFNDDELETNNLINELENFFEGLKPISHALTDEIIREQENLRRQRNEMTRELDALAEKLLIPKGKSNLSVDRQSRKDLEYNALRKEWFETIDILRHIGGKIADYRPIWLTEDYPKEWEADQFLHAYYEHRRAISLHDSHTKNEADPAAALEEALKWWASLPQPPSDADKNLSSRCFFRKALSRENISNLDEDVLIKICQHTFALREHLRKVSPGVIGSMGGESVSMDDRCRWMGNNLARARNKRGWDIKKLFQFVLYENNDDLNKAVENLFTAAKDPQHKFDRVGLNTLAEIMGWVKPELVPPRNGRTSKALYALGFPVKLH